MSRSIRANRGRGRAWVAALAVGAAFVAGGAEAQDDSLVIAALAGGVGGGFDAEDGRGFDHPVLQASVGFVTNERTYTVLRAGRLSLDEENAYAGYFDAEIDYLTVAGEYRIRQPAYDYGFFVGVGGYRVSGVREGASDDETALGILAGVSGDFDLTRRLSIVAELGAHYVYFDQSGLYGTGLVGLAFHF